MRAKNFFWVTLIVMYFCGGMAMAENMHSGKLILSETGSVKTAPDMASIQIGVSTDAKEAKKALEDNSRKMTAVYEALKNAGIDKKDLQTSRFNLQPRYDYDKRENGTPLLTGYQASNMLSVTVRELDKLGSILDAVVKAGGTNVENISFGLDNPEALRDKAREQAVAKLKARASLYAKAAGVRPGRILEISESEGHMPVPVMARMAFDSAASAASLPPPVAEGQVDVQVEVKMIFEISASGK